MFLKVTLIILGVLLAVAAVVGLVIFIRKRAEQQAQEDPAQQAEKKAAEAKAAAVRSRRNAIFAANLKRLDGTGTGWDQRYRVPWCLLVGEPGVGRTSLLRSIELHRPFGAPETDTTKQGECDFWFFDRGLVLDAPVSLEQSDDRWIGVLQSIRRARRQRPIDSVVLAIPATDLTGPTKLDGAKLKDKAEGLYRTLRRIQEELGVLMPIYVMVTKTDAVPGFAESCRALPVSAWEEMFGWSAPYSFETGYSPEWVSDAFKNINATIAQTQMDLLAASPAELKDPDAVYTLPAEFSALETPLRTLLDQVFKPTSYHEPFALRGIYFSGDPNAVETGPAGMDGAVVPVDLGPNGRRPIFTTQLFESKIFPERGLSRPATRSKVGNRRAIMALQYSLGAVAILAPLGLWTAASSLGRKIPTLADSANIISQNLFEVKQARDAAPAKPIDPDDIKHHAADTMQAISRIKAEHIWQLQLPTSWFSDIDNVLRGALQQTFEDVVLYSYNVALDQKRTSLLGESEIAAAAANQSRLVAPANMIEFQALQTIDKEMQTFSDYVGEYNNLNKADPSHKLDTVNHLAKYLLSLNLGPSFIENGDLYSDSLKNVNYITFDQLAGAKVEESAQALSLALIRHAFQQNAVENDLKEVVQDITEVESSNADPDAMVGLIKKLADAIGRAKADVGSPEMAWLAQDDLGEPFTGLLTSLKKSKALSPSVSQSFDDRWHAEYKEMRRRLFSYSTSGTGPLLVAITSDAKLPGVPSAAQAMVPAAAAKALGTAQALVTAATATGVLGKDVSLQLSDKVLALSDALDTFLAQPFIKVDRSESVAAIIPSEDLRILWTVDSLDKALKLGEPYNKYVQEKLPTAPEHIRTLLDEYSKAELELDVRYLTQKAERAEVSEGSESSDATRSEMSTELSSLKRVINQLRSLYQMESDLELTGAQTDLRRTLLTQGQSLLHRTDNVLEQGELYTPDAKLEQWQGVRPPALEAFDLAGADALGQYLRTQRTRAADLARDFAATPIQLLDFVTSNTDRPALLVKWQRITSELAARDAMQPGNSVQAIEQFIQADMLDLTRDNCLGRLPKRSSEDGDFFLGKLAQLRNILRRRCESLNGAKLLAKYDLLASTFNETLAGRFPFAADESETQEGDASPHDITKFLREYDAYMPEFENFKAQSDRTMTNGSWGPFTHDMLVFLDQMKEIRHFFGPLLSQDGVDVTPRYGLRLVPRVNRMRENLANQIINWDLLLSGQHADVKAAMWSLGDPVRVAFRWAKDAPQMPSRDGQQKNVSVSDDDTVNFDFGGSWSLLRLIRAQQAPTTDLDGGVDGRPHTLEFQIRVEDRPTGEEAFGTTAATAKARAFVRVSLTAPDGVTRLVAPKVWPVRAPQVVGLQSNPAGDGGPAKATPADGDDSDGMSPSSATQEGQ